MTLDIASDLGHTEVTPESVMQNYRTKPIMAGEITEQSQNLQNDNATKRFIITLALMSCKKT